MLHKVQLMTIVIVRARSTGDPPPFELCKKPVAFNAKFAASGARTTTVVVQTINSVIATIRLTTQQPELVISFKHQRRSARTHTYPPKPLRT